MSQEMKIADVSRLGIDIAKNVFQLHAVDRDGRICLRRRLSRKQLAAFTQQLPPCLIGMEACAGSHYWGRVFEQQGHRVGLMAGQHVKRFARSTNKDDAIDAEAICEAVGRPDMFFVPIKSEFQLEVQALHRCRQQHSKAVTRLSNQMRGFLMEHGIVIPKGVSHIPKRIPLILEDADNGLSLGMREIINDLYEQFKTSRQRLAELDIRLGDICKSHDTCMRACQVPGIGPVTATALYAAIGKGVQFKNGRCAAAWLGLVPRHKGTGGKIHNGKMSKRGNRYIKTLAIQGGRSQVLAAARKHDQRSKAITQQAQHKGGDIAAVACAHRAIRVAWALMAKDAEYKEAA
ncbi:MAG: IS110 family transposase [Chitinivibrionales bacterium]|nr:IS110 family transposase [Chitinivibrionales bacterium]